MAKGVEALLDQEAARVPLQGHGRHVDNAVPPGLQLLVDVLFHEELRPECGEERRGITKAHGPTATFGGEKTPWPYLCGADAVHVRGDRAEFLQHAHAGPAVGKDVRSDVHHTAVPGRAE